MRGSDLIRAAALATSLAAAPALAEAPARVVSMNLCIDQLAMVLAAPGQLVSVSALASDPRMSPMADRAQAYPANHGRAEEIYLMRPDLVIAGQYTAPATLALLERLGIRVEVLPPAESFAAIADQITRIGAMLGRDDQAARLRAGFEAALDRAPLGKDRGRAALYYANGYTSGRATLAGEIVAAAGYGNVAEDFGITDTRALPLELMVMAQPDRVITGATWPGRSRAEAILDHPALAAVAPAPPARTTRDWICGTPGVLRAVEALE